ncbi:MAG TPA: hypothetical protein VF531_04270 [Bacillota bacterium]
MPLVNYNRSLLSNFANSSTFVLTAANQLVLEFGLFVPQTPNFVELLTTAGWTVTNVSPVEPNQPTLMLTITQDGVPVATSDQESIEDRGDEPLENLATFQAVLTNVPTGFHVYRLFARNIQPAQGTITITGPTNISAKVITV